MGISLGWMGWAGPKLTLALFTVYSLAAGFAYPLQRQAMNEAIPDSRFRATLISVESLIDLRIGIGSDAILHRRVRGKSQCDSHN